MTECEFRVDDERFKIVRTLAATKKRFVEYAWKFVRARSLRTRYDRKERKRERERECLKSFKREAKFEKTTLRRISSYLEIIILLLLLRF